MTRLIARGPHHAAPGDGPSALQLALAALAVWRVTHLLAEEDGPGDAVLRIRARLGDGFAGRLMDCFYCLSVWVAAPFSIGLARPRRTSLRAWLAVSGAACLIEEATRALARDSPDNPLKTSRTS